jgi:hypothetical protein
VQIDEAVSDTEQNTCATSYVTADNSRPVALYVNERIKTDLSKIGDYFIPKNKTVHSLNNYLKLVTIFLILQTFNLLQRLNCKTSDILRVKYFNK